MRAGLVSAFGAVIWTGPRFDIPHFDLSYFRSSLRLGGVCMSFQSLCVVIETYVPIPRSMASSMSRKRCVVVSFGLYKLVRYRVTRSISSF